MKVTVIGVVFNQYPLKKPLNPIQFALMAYFQIEIFKKMEFHTVGTIGSRNRLKCPELALFISESEV